MTLANQQMNDVAEKTAEIRLKKFEGNFGMIKDHSERESLKSLYKNQAAMEIHSSYKKMLENIYQN